MDAPALRGPLALQLRLASVSNLNEPRLQPHQSRQQSQQRQQPQSHQQRLLHMQAATITQRKYKVITESVDDKFVYFDAAEHNTKPVK